MEYFSGVCCRQFASNVPSAADHNPTVVALYDCQTSKDERDASVGSESRISIRLRRGSGDPYGNSIGTFLAFSEPGKRSLGGVEAAHSVHTATGWRR
jgi:hypothetical protein